MKYGSLPRSLARSLPAGLIEPTHSPDGLTEADIDAMAAEAGIDLEPPTDDEPDATVIPLRPAGQSTRLPFGNEAA
jgi:hypothetical protein